METNLSLMDKFLPALFFTLIVASTVMKFVDHFIDANHCKKEKNSCYTNVGFFSFLSKFFLPTLD